MKSKKKYIGFMVMACSLLTVGYATAWLGKKDGASERETLRNGYDAVNVVQVELGLQCELPVAELKGGVSAARLFKVSCGSNNYVVRFIPHKSEAGRRREIFNLKKASNGGYGAHIYFADSDRGVAIMEYLPPTPAQQALSQRAYISFAELLRKIHADELEGDFEYDVFKKIFNDIKAHKIKFSHAPIPWGRIEQAAIDLHEGLAPHLTSSWTHNDLHGGNLFYVGDNWKAIDYDHGGVGDPYFDIATVATYFYQEPQREVELMNTYLGRTPSAVELARLKLMKQVVLIKWIVDALNRLKPESMEDYAAISAPEFLTVRDMVMSGNFDLGMQQSNLILLKAVLKKLFDLFDSEETKQALDLLSGQTP